MRDTFHSFVHLSTHPHAKFAAQASRSNLSTRSSCDFAMLAIPVATDKCIDKTLKRTVACCFSQTRQAAKLNQADNDHIRVYITDSTIDGRSARVNARRVMNKLVGSMSEPKEETLFIQANLSTPSQWKRTSETKIAMTNRRPHHRSRGGRLQPWPIRWTVTYRTASF
jgi:hypothetical protein